MCRKDDNYNWSFSQHKSVYKISWHKLHVPVVLTKDVYWCIYWLIICVLVCSEACDIGGGQTIEFRGSRWLAEICAGGIVKICSRLGHGGKLTFQSKMTAISISFFLLYISLYAICRWLNLCIVSAKQDIRRLYYQNTEYCSTIFLLK